MESYYMTNESLIGLPLSQAHEAIKNAITSLKNNELDGWELQLVLRHIEEIYEKLGATDGK